MDKAQVQLDSELERLTSLVEKEPDTTLSQAQQSQIRADQTLYQEGGIQAGIIISRCYWELSDYRSGLKAIKDVHTRLNQLDTDQFLPEILHIHAQHYWGQEKYISAQQYWINALEQAALVGETDIEIESLIGLGNVWRISREYKLAMSTHTLAVNVANNARINWLEGKARIALAWDHYLLNDFTEMLSVLDGAEEVLKHYPNDAWKAEIWDFRALALLGLERLEDAENASVRAYKLAVKENISWMKTHSFISRARLELIRGNLDSAEQSLAQAERSAKKFDNGELLSQICFQQSIVAEKQNDYETALTAFRKYRKHSVKLLKDQTNRLSTDKAHSSKRQLDQRARKLINRIRGQVEFRNDGNGYSNQVSETYWWEQLVLFKSELKATTHVVVLISHQVSDYLDICIELAQCVCNRNDLIARLSEDRVGMLVAEKGEAADKLFQFLKQMINNYPWDRRGLTGPQPKVSQHDILTFPFTLEQLEEDMHQPVEEESDG
ncbi:hypothetical protein DI392_14625 [Vibrio albus]|uniref:ATP-dependent transcriptional regulator n=1 Tax=Vibrio albus TaxID=2200953 RepID=A0A2U3B785_9VIBR|nr:hypothetical protein [Vibrio albus]PWI32647.1 hypothetical protein DI392_14625 [Vibrio albus]